ncbi:histidine kinase dimerization/phosphoacceptor domain -containing protein [Flavitalea sp. BT771]|uniref:histidine kinase dimerization/phosphoacceptor domain -containing protein n=1 Tax=Flavitalea sp. BT771 TaxID=3063329 RepID=UPI0026E2667F|nr:histidine kinase dimerization/phosphoacceptor domain -containing protein [Flavitalea sp. BT771]MDO6435624.1 histidine kinase dimerization/phosphoacceptor domain -containing protein [Flavitalea sp. BT771]MDV6224524.1 histidine kinase dimerization/phosphoacceptor domain -containing protein [Flavitalea sp. BT771]
MPWSIFIKADPRLVNRSVCCILVLAWAISGPCLFAQSNPANDNAGYTINKRFLSIEDGLASHEVFCGLQDTAGFLWFGTRNGLNRYDGKNCLLFTHQRNNLQDNKVVQLAKDDADRLFIEYSSTGFQLSTIGKVDVMNAATQEVKTLTAAFPNMPFKEQDVYWISNDGTDEINFLTAFPFRLWKYSSKHGFHLRYEIKDWNRYDTLPLVDYRSTGPLCMFAKGKALLKLFNQSTQYLISADTVIAFTQKDALRSLPMGFTSQNDLLIAYNTKTESNTFNVGMISHTGNSEFPAHLQNFNTDSIKGRYWYQAAGSADGASCIFYISTDALYLWNESAFLKIVARSEMKAFENLFLYQLFPDNLGNLWLCTSHGVLQLKIEKSRFRQYFTGKQQNIQPNSQVRGIYADDSGRIVANIWTHTFMQQDGKMQYTANEEIKYALIKHHSELYCGGNDLFYYDDKKNKTVKFATGQRSEIWSMFSLNDSLLLLGRTSGFSLFNSNTRKIDSLSPANKNIPEARFVYRFFKNKDDTLWAVAENGLYKIAAANGHWSVSYERSPVINALILQDTYADADGIYWLATNGEGLYRWDRKADSFRQFNITSGFPSDVLYRLEPDGYDNLWISSDYGLIRFNRKTLSVRTYTTGDGISHNEFNRTSSFRAKDGRLFFGGLDGVNAFDPKDFTTDTNAFNIPFRIIAFHQFIGSRSELVNKTNDLLNTSQIKLAPNDQFFTLEFQLLDFAKNEVSRYAYQIEGIDGRWNYISENSIRISGLPYGRFTLHIKAQSREGAWSRSVLSIPLIVLKPFYLEWWFLALITLAFATAVYWIINRRTKQLAAEKNKLEKLVNERTAQLKQSLSTQAELLVEKDVLMKEIHHRVKNNLQVISGLLELQSKSLNDEAARDALQDGRSRVRSIALIHQNLYQFENISTIELGRFVNDLCRQVESVFHMKNKVVMNIEVPHLHLDIDTAVPLGLIMNELLSNSFKYAFNNGKSGEINLEIRTRTEGKYDLTYSDNGPGLPVDLDVRKAKTLGMQLINDLSRQIGGKVKYENNNGAMFTINFTNRNMRKNED